MKQKVCCIFVLDLLKIFFFWKINVLKIQSKFFAVTFKTNRKNDQVQGLVVITIILQRKFRSYRIDFLSEKYFSLGRNIFRFISREKYHDGVLLHKDHSG